MEAQTETICRHTMDFIIQPFIPCQPYRATENEHSELRMNVQRQKTARGLEERNSLRNVGQISDFRWVQVVKFVIQGPAQNTDSMHQPGILPSAFILWIFLVSLLDFQQDF